MPSFKYTARDRSGKATSGVVQAADSDELRRILRSNDLYLVNHRGGGEARAKSAGPRQPGLFDRRVKLQDMVIATRQLSTMIRSGIPILQALEIIGSQSTVPMLKTAFKDMEDMVAEGQKMSTAMRKYPKLFNQLVVALTEAGETAGTLEFTLEVAANQLDREDDLRRKVKSATFYPKLVLAAAVGTVAVMMVVVVPVFSDVYKSFHSALPAPTLLLMAVSDFTVHYWWAAVLLVVAGIYGLRKYRETPGGQRRIDIILLKLPVFGPLLRKIAIARFVQTLSGALKGGVNVLRSLTIAGQTVGNVVLRDAVIAAAQNVRDGSTIAEELDKTGEFPIMVTRMIGAGEESGNVDEMLDEINRFYERDVEHAVTQMTRLIEPAMTVMVGGIVLLVLLALYSPIFKLGETFRNSK